jgi:hypothetical protein
VNPPIREADFTQLLEAVDRPVDGGSGATDTLSDTHNRMTGMEKEQNTAAGGFYFVRGFANSALDAPALGTVQIQIYIHGREVLLQKFCVVVTTKRIQEASHFNTAHLDPSAHLDPMF